MSHKPLLPRHSEGLRISNIGSNMRRYLLEYLQKQVEEEMVYFPMDSEDYHILEVEAARRSEDLEDDQHWGG